MTTGTVRRAFSLTAWLSAAPFFFIHKRVYIISVGSFALKTCIFLNKILKYFINKNKKRPTENGTHTLYGALKSRRTPCIFDYIEKNSNVQGLFNYNVCSVFGGGARKGAS